MTEKDYMQGAARVALETLLVFVTAFGLFALYILPADAVFTIDGFYHFAIAEQIAKNGFWVDISWLPMTVLGDHGTDHHWFWHLLLSPFAYMDDRVLAFKLALITNAAMVPAVLSLVCRLLGVPCAPAWAVALLALGVFFPARILMLRAQNIGIICLLLAGTFAIRRSYLLLTATVFIAIESYHGALLLSLPIAIVALVSGVQERKLDTKLLLYPAAGLMGGLVLNPWFPENFGFLFFHVLFTAGNSLGLPAGSEWRATGLADLLKQSWPAHFLWVGSLAWIALEHRDRLRQLPVVTLNLLGMATLALYISSNRFIEYYIPIAVLASAMNLLPLWNHLGRQAIAAIMAISFVFCSWRIAVNMDVYRSVSHAEFTMFSEIIDTLESRAPPGTLVFNGSGDDFPLLMWQSTSFKYVNGLSSHFLAYESPIRFLNWMKIVGYQPFEGDTASLILSAFGTEWVIVARTNQSLHLRLAKSPNAELILLTRWGYLYHLAVAE